MKVRSWAGSIRDSRLRLAELRLRKTSTTLAIQAGGMVWETIQGNLSRAMNGDFNLLLNPVGKGRASPPALPAYYHWR